MVRFSAQSHFMRQDSRVYSAAKIAAAVGSIPNPFHQIVLGAKYGEWETDREQLKEAALRRSWNLWYRQERSGQVSLDLNTRAVCLVLAEWYLEPSERGHIFDTTRAAQMGVDYRRYRSQFKEHHIMLLTWLDVVTAEALESLQTQLRERNDI